MSFDKISIDAALALYLREDIKYFTDYISHHKYYLWETVPDSALILFLNDDGTMYINKDKFYWSYNKIRYVKIYLIKF